MRKATLLTLILILVFATAGMGQPIFEGGKLAVSNLTPLLFVVFAAVIFLGRRQSIDRRVAWFILLFNLSCVVSFIIFLVQYGWEPNFPVLLFQDVEMLVCILLWWFGSESPADFRLAVKAGILCSIPVTIFYGLQDFHIGLLFFRNGMDDKSQGAVLLCCEAYVLIRFFGSKLDRMLGAALYIASFLTISRLPVFFFPAIFFGLVRHSRATALVTFLATGVAVYVVVTAGSTVEKLFVVYQRLSSVDTIESSGSTQAHFELLKTALEIKFTQPYAFLFGIGPDNFSKALLTVPSAVATMQSLDPQLVEYAEMGKAPLHSTSLELLVDYNIALSLLFVYCLLRVFRFLVARRNMTDLLFACATVLSSTFYSLHNKSYYYLYLTTIALLMAADAPARVAADDPGDAQALAISGAG